MKPAARNGTLKKLLYILAGLGGISLIILIHEAGHFLFAKLFNVPTPVFSLGFGPALYAFTIGKTVFKLALFPIGGYVEMDPEILAQQHYIPKMLIVFGGILFNLIFAYCVLLYYAIRNHYVLTSTISSITPNSPAEKSGLQPHDIIIAYNHQPINSNAEMITKTIAASEGKTIILTIKRNGKEHEIPVALNMEHPLFGKNVGWLGIDLEKKRSAARPSLRTSVHEGHKKFAKTTQEVGHAASNIMTQKDHHSVIMGPIGIIAMIGKSLAINPQFYWFILAILSLNMGLFNVLPLPFFDGGKALLFTIEALIGKTIPPTLLWFISMIFLALFMFVLMRVTMHDIKRLIKR